MTAQPFTPTTTITEADVVRAIKTASIRQLANALDEGAFLRDHGPDGFICPDCGRWAAEVVDPCRWMCDACGRHSTRLALRNRVADDAFACLRLVRTILGERHLS